MKTIDEIVCDMLSVADSAEKKHIYDLRELGSDSLRAYANLIKEAHKRYLAEAVAAKCEVCDQVAVAKSATTTATCKDSLQVGNAMKMREVVAETEKSIDKAISILEEIPETCGFAGLLEDACDVLCYLKEEFVKPALCGKSYW